MAHAKLSPSATSRWSICTIAPSLEEKYPDSSSGFADEGTLAHSYAETFLRYRDDSSALKKALEALEKDQHYEKHYSEELVGHAEDFANYVLEHCTRDYSLYIEEKLDMSRWIPEGFGTADAIVVKDGVLDLIDLKYGKGVKVSSVENKQLMVYALGCIERFGWMYDFHTVRMHIYQPRLNNISVWSMSVSDLIVWGELFLKPQARKAFDGVGVGNPGDHCRFCKAKGDCSALAAMAEEFAKQEFAEPRTLSNEMIGELLPKLEVVAIAVAAIKENAYAKVLGGEKIPGWKMVQGKQSRYYTDPAAIRKELLENGFKEDDILTQPKERELLSLTALEKKVKKANFEKYVAQFVDKKRAAPTLAPSTDPREEYSVAELDFADELTEDESWMS